MALQTQLSRNPGVDGDQPFKNTSGTAIAAKAAVILDGTNVRGIVGITLGGGGSMALYVGVAAESIAAGKAGRVQVKGEAVMVASGSISFGDWIVVDVANGKEGRAKTAGAGVQTIGKALSSAVDGDDVLVQLMGPAKNA